MQILSKVGKPTVIKLTTHEMRTLENALNIAKVIAMNLNPNDRASTWAAMSADSLGKMLESLKSPVTPVTNGEQTVPALDGADVAPVDVGGFAAREEPRAAAKKKAAKTAAGEPMPF